MGTFTTLAVQLLDQCKQLDAHLSSSNNSKNNSSPSAPGGFDEYLLQDIPSSLYSVRSSILNTAQKLSDLTTEPKDHISQIIYGHTDVLCLQAIQRYQLAEYVPRHGSITFAEVSKLSGLDEGLVKRFMQLASLKNIFRQTSTDTVAHTPASRLLVGSQGLNDEVGFQTNEMNTASLHALQALEKYPHPREGAITEQNKTGFSVANNTSDPIYTELAKHPERIRRFGNAMRSMTSGTVYDVAHLVNGYDWASLAKRGAMVVDIGGGQGGISRALTSAYPGLKCVVQDLPNIVKAGEATLSAEEKLGVSFMGHDFFTPQKMQPDVFFLRWILHNWSDKYCVQILRNLVPGLRPGARVVVYEYLLPEVSEPGSRYDYYRRVVDIIMFAAFAGAERSPSQFVSLFQQADPRFRLVSTLEKPESAMGILEMELAE